MNWIRVLPIIATLLTVSTALFAFDKTVPSDLSKFGHENSDISAPALQTQPLKNAIDEAIQFLRSKTKFSSLNFPNLKFVVLSQKEMDSKFCGDQNCKIMASYKDGVLSVSVNLLERLTQNSIQAQGIVVHELTHYAQNLIRNSQEEISCQEWKGFEIEALTYQNDYLQIMGQALFRSNAHYGNVCRP